ncbi:hypothetical protein Tco_0927147 [Tanacetum coccineum]
MVEETLGDTSAQTRFERISKTSNDPLGDDSLKLTELLELCTNLQQRVLDLENTKTAQAQEITGLKLESRSLRRREGQGLIRKIDDIDADEEITLVDETAEEQRWIDDEVMFEVSDLVGEEVIVAKKGVSDVATTVSIAATTITHEEITLAQALQELKIVKPKAKGIVFKEPVESTTITLTPIPLKTRDKGKGIMEEPEKPMKKKDQILFDEEIALFIQAQMQAELEEEDRLAREKE